MLEETIDKIGILLQMGFGKVGSVIMGPNFTESGELTLFRQGEHKNVIIAMCKIKKFTEIIDAI